MEMADTPAQEEEPALTDDDALRQRLLGRIAVAAVVIVGLLGSLAMFDALYAPRVAPPAKIATVTPPVVPSASDGEAKPVEKTEPATSEASAVKPELSPTNPLPLPPPTVAEGTAATPASALPPLPVERLTKPALPQQAMVHPGMGSSTAKPVTPVTPAAPVARSEVQREVARAATQAAVPSQSPRHAPASRPLSRSPQGIAGLEESHGSTQSFALQLGVFSNFSNAEELRAKLEAAGIPATVEARVRVGPFASRGEADAARVKLRSLGISESILVSVKR
jgi:DedD protein